MALFKSQGGFITSYAVTAALRQYGLQDGVVRRCWREAKITSQPPLDKMNKAEWMKACRLAVKAGGKPLEMEIAAKLTELGVVDEHSDSEDDASSGGEIPPPSKPRMRASTRESDDADGAMAQELLADGESDSDSSDPESDGHQRRLLRMQQRSRSAVVATNTFRVSPRAQRAASASPPKHSGAPASIRRF